MAYREGECFNCGKKIPVGSVCDKCAKDHGEEELQEESWGSDNL